MLPIMTIVSKDAPGGCMIINASDFDAKSMKVWTGDAPWQNKYPAPVEAEVAPVPAEETPAAPVAVEVTEDAPPSPVEPEIVPASVEPPVEPIADPSLPIEIRKGPRGLFYAYQGDARITGGFATEDEALAAVTSA
jgi:hypothetical protein